MKIKRLLKFYQVDSNKSKANNTAKYVIFTNKYVPNYCRMIFLKNVKTKIKTE